MQHAQNRGNPSQRSRILHSPEGGFCQTTPHIEHPIPFNEIQNYVHDFKSTQTISMTMGGWFPKDKQPPVLEPPASTNWIKNQHFNEL